MQFYAELTTDSLALVVSLIHEALDRSASATATFRRRENDLYYVSIAEAAREAD